MTTTGSKSRFLRLLRRTATNAQKTQGRGVAEENAIWLSHERAVVTTKTAAEAAQRIASAAAKQRSTFEATAEQARAAAARTPELERMVIRVRDAFERLGLIALNAGLEGARLGETSGRSLSLVSDEVRTLSERGVEAVRELAQGIADVGRETGSLAARIGDAQAQSGEIGQDAALASSSTLETERVLNEMGERLRKATGSDPETLRSIATATEHARQLVVALGALSGKVPRALLVSTLRPVLEPLLRVVADEEPEGEADE
jgi:methyl-accepting chemotaxis protein